VPQERPLDAIESSPPNAHAVSDTDERVNGKRNLLPDRDLQALDFFVRDWSPYALTTDETKNPRSPQHFQTLFFRLVHADKRIAGEQWHIHSGAAIAPLAYFFHKRKKSKDLIFLEPLGDAFFVPRHEVNRVPTGFIPGMPKCRIYSCSCGGYMEIVHNFVLSVPLGTVLFF
jgi:hypothetical protein